MVVWHMTPELACIVPDCIGIAKERILIPPLKLSGDEEKKQGEEETSKYYNYTEAQNIFLTLVMKAKYANQCGNFWLLKRRNTEPLSQEYEHCNINVDDYSATVK